MKYAYFIRHGKSSWKFQDLSDKDRPLKKRGRRDGLLMGQMIKKAGIKPDTIVSSPANRAYSSAVIIAEEVGFPKDSIIKNEDIYFSGVSAIYNIVQNLDNSDNVAFIFGHNPDFTSVVNDFIADPIYNLPTTGVAGIEFDIEKWEDASKANGKLILLDFPSRHN